MAQNTFTITSDTYTLKFNLPEYGGATRTLTKDLALFNFWVGDISVIDKGIGDEPLVLGGIELNSIASELCFPACFPICFDSGLCTKFIKVWDIQNDGEEITISGLGDTLDGVYVIRSFDFETIKGTNLGFAWRFELEWVRSA